MCNISTRVVPPDCFLTILLGMFAAVVARGEDKSVASDQDTTLTSGSTCQVTLETAKSKFDLLEPIELIINVSNTGKAPIGRTRVYPFNPASCRVVDSEGARIPLTELGEATAGAVSSGRVTIKPGETYQERFPLTWAYDLSLPGKYKVRAPRAHVEKTEASPDGIVWSEYLELEIESPIFKPPVTMPSLKLPLVFKGEEHDGYQIIASMHKEVFAPLEPIEVGLRFINSSGEPLRYGRRKEWRPALYKFECKAKNQPPELPPPQYGELRLTRYGQLHPVCEHNVSEPLQPGQAHEDDIFMNLYYDMTLISYSGTRELRVTAQAPGHKSAEKKATATVGPLPLRFSGGPWTAKKTSNSRRN